jgi:hypothetical protein
MAHNNDSQEIKVRKRSELREMQIIALKGKSGYVLFKLICAAYTQKWWRQILRVFSFLNISSLWIVKKNRITQFGRKTE